MIHKSMSTVLQAMMCFLYDEKGFIDSGRVFSRELAKNRYGWYLKLLNTSADFVMAETSRMKYPKHKRQSPKNAQILVQI